MQKIVEFKKRNFWSSRIDMTLLNEKIEQYNKDGWMVINITPIFTLFGVVSGYTLLIQLKG